MVELLSRGEKMRAVEGGVVCRGKSYYLMPFGRYVCLAGMVEFLHLFSEKKSHVY